MYSFEIVRHLADLARISMAWLDEDIYNLYCIYMNSNIEVYMVN